MYTIGEPAVRPVICRAAPQVVKNPRVQGILTYLNKPCGYTAMLLASREDCPKCGTEGYLDNLDEDGFFFAKGNGVTFFHHGEKPQRGPVTCPICGNRTVKRMLAEYGRCRPCQTIREKVEKQNAKAKVEGTV